MPLLRRLFWPFLLVPLGGAGAILVAAGRAGRIEPVHALFALMAAAFSCAVFGALWGAYRQWSQPAPAVEGALVTPEPVVLVSRGGFLTPGSGLFTREKVFLYARGQAVVTVPLERLSAARFLLGRWLKTPYVELVGTDGRSLGRLGVESAKAWAEALAPLIAGSKTPPAPPPAAPP